MSGPADSDSPSGYDSLPAAAQARVRAEWARRMDHRRAQLDFAREFVAAGEPYAELDERGNVVRRVPPVEP